MLSTPIKQNKTIQNKIKHQYRIIQVYGIDMNNRIKATRIKKKAYNTPFKNYCPRGMYNFLD